MEQNRNPRFVVWCTVPAGQRPVQGQAGSGPAGRDARYGPGLGQSAPKAMRDVPSRAGPPKAAFGGGDAGYKPLMLQLGTVGSHAVVQFGVEVKVKTSGQPTKEYVDIANFDRYDMIIGMPFMRKNKVLLDFVNNRVIVNGTPLRAERVVLAEMALMGAIEAGVRTRAPVAQAAGPSTRGLTTSFHAPATQGPSRPPWGAQAPPQS
ncbi:hypothetical protein C0992_000658 [Termitomyces sp. T32_za158]|nr:hypothetical protein C0992_000654 [Termitomyces sp. T32_za158]KAG6895556.1 hypothetical protein C0992_000658 [Termitomyces sp. T32_za158]